ncbi:MAG: futalosine hydrolase [Thermodesulfovibrionales bacterium]|nr:futalosine hydrolase [Thermodesulfovibrionales bacterium]
MRQSPIGMISATQREARLILKNLKKTSSGNFYKGKIGWNNVIHVISGIGKTNASHAATFLIEKFSPLFIINFGIGGAYPSSGLRPGDIAIADREIYGDEGLWLKDGFHKTDVMGIPLLKKSRKKYFNEFPLDKNLVKKAMKVIPPNPPLIKGGWGDYGIRTGAFITVSTATGTHRRARQLEKRFSAICENMEGAAIAHVCAMYGIPMVEIRGISNIVEDRDKSKWDIRTAAENCQKIILTLVKEGRM